MLVVSHFCLTVWIDVKKILQNVSKQNELKGERGDSGVKGEKGEPGAGYYDPHFGGVQGPPGPPGSPGLPVSLESLNLRLRVYSLGLSTCSVLNQKKMKDLGQKAKLLVYLVYTLTCGH